MQIVVLDAKTVTNGDLDLSVFNEFGEVTMYPLTAEEDVADRVRDAEVILCNKTPMTERTLRGAARLRYIGLFATGYNNVELSYTARRGITVCNAGGYSTMAVAQHAFALILEHFSRVSDYRAFVDEGGWIGSDIFSPFVYPMQELSGKTIGLVGYGQIGRAVAAIAAAFGMTVLVYTRTPRPEENVTFVDFEALLRRSDILSVHCPLTAQTARLFDAAAFARCREGAFFVNTSRGGVVDERALREALKSGKLSGAALDVLDREPMREDCVLRGAPGLILTPHVAWAPRETRQRLVDQVAQTLRAFLDGTPQNVITG